MSGAPPGPSLSSEVLRGTRWSIASSLARQGIRFLNTLILARFFLAPDAFGLMAMALVVVEFVNLLRDLGTGRALIATAELSDSLVSSVFWLNVGIASLLALCIFLGSGALAAAFSEPRVEAIFQVLSLGLLLGVVGVVPIALLQRHLEFGKLAACDVANAVAFVFTSLALAVNGAGVWSLVIATLVSTAIESSCAMLAARYWPGGRFNLDEIRSIWSFSTHLTLFNITTYLFQNLDRVLIGRYLGAPALGVYFLANRLLEFSVRFLLRRVLAVVFPALARVSEDDERLRSGVLRAGGGVALVLFPILMGIGSVGESLVAVALDPRWSGVAPLLPLLAVRYVAEALIRVGSVLYSVKQRTDIQFYWGLGSGVVFVASYFIGLPWGLYGVVAARTVAIVSLLYVSLRLSLGLIDLRVRRMAREIGPYALGVAIMMLGVSAVLRMGAQADLPHLARLICGATAGALLYTGTLAVLRPPGLRDLRRLAMRGRGR